MNILYSFRTRGVGAESVHISGISDALEKLGHPVDFESPTGMDPRKQAGTNPYSNNKGSILHRLANRLPGILFEFAEIAYNWHAGKRVRQRLKQKKYGLIYERHAFFLTITSYIAYKANIPYVIEVNELVGDERVRKQPLLTPIAKWCDRQTFLRASRIVVVSPHLKRKIIEEHHIPEDKILVHPNAVCASLLEEKPDPGPFIEKYNLEGKLNIGFVGWFVEWHRLDLLLKAISELVKDNNGLKPNLLLIGDGPLKGELLSLAGKLGIQEHLTYTGAMDHTEIPAIIRAIDIAVIPHSNEFRSPIKLFEYMAQARPVVAPSSEPIRSVVTHKINAMLFPPLDQDAFTCSLRELSLNPDLRKKLGEKARDTVLEKHTWNHNASHLLKEIEKSIL